MPANAIPSANDTLQTFLPGPLFHLGGQSAHHTLVKFINSSKRELFPSFTFQYCPHEIVAGPQLTSYQLKLNTRLQPHDRWTSCNDIGTVPCSPPCSIHSSYLSNPPSAGKHHPAPLHNFRAVAGATLMIDLGLVLRTKLNGPHLVCCIDEDEMMIGQGSNSKSEHGDDFSQARQAISGCLRPQLN
jgi:hypothetical protein